MTSVRGMVVHFLCIEPENKRGSQNLYKWKVFEGAVHFIKSVCIVLEFVPQRSKKLFEPLPQNKILLPFRGSFQNL